MNRLRKLILLVPLMLLAAASDVLADVTETVSGSTTVNVSNDWSATKVKIYSEIFRLAQVDDEIIITKTSDTSTSHTLWWGFNGDNGWSTQDGFTSSKTITLISANVADLKFGGLSLTALGSSGTFTVSVQIRLKNESSASITYGRERNLASAGVLGKDNDGTSGYGGFNIPKACLSDIKENDVITVTPVTCNRMHYTNIKAGDTNLASYDLKAEASTVWPASGWPAGKFELTVTSANKDAIIANGLTLNGNGTPSNSENDDEHTYTVNVTLKRPNVNLFQIPYASGSNLTPQGAIDNNNALLFDSSLFTATSVPKGAQEGWNPGLWIQCSDDSKFENIDHLAFRVVRWDSSKNDGSGGWATVSKNGKNLEAGNFSFENGVRSVRYNSTTKQVWFQFSNDMLDELYTGACLLVVDNGNFTITDANYDLDDNNESRNWNYVTGITVSGANTVNKSSSITLTSTLTYKSDDASLNKLSNVYWSSSDPTIATVDSSTGEVTGVSAGSVTITAVPWDNRTVSAEHVVTVGDPDYTIMTINVDTNFDGVNDMNRTYAVKKPTSAAANMPLVISLHGLGNDYNNGRPDFNSYATSNQAVVVYPRGTILTDIWGGTSRGWQARDSYNNGVKDIDVSDQDSEFLRAIIDHAIANPSEYGATSIDASRVYVAGFSNGGMMAYWAASKLGDKIAAFASVGGFPVNEFHLHNSGVRPVPFVHIHGTADGTVNPTTYSINTHLQNMMFRNGTSFTPITTSGSNYTEYTYSPSSDKIAADGSIDESGTEGTPFKYYSVTDMGHVADYGSFDIPDTMWNFFSSYTLPAADNTKYNNGWSTLKFRADFSTLPGGSNIGDFHFHKDDAGAGVYALRFLTDGKTDANKNVYHSLQFETTDANNDGFVQGLFRFRIKVTGDDSKYISVRLINLNNATIINKRYNLKDMNGTEGNGTTVTGYIKGNFNLPKGWNEYSFAVYKGNASDDTTVGLVEFSSGKFTDPTPDAAFNPDDLPQLANMNLVRQPKFGVLQEGSGVAKSYFPIDNIYMQYSGDRLTALNSNWTENPTTPKTISGGDGIYINNIVRDVTTTDEYDKRTIAFVYDRTKTGTSYTITPTNLATDDGDYGSNPTIGTVASMKLEKGLCLDANGGSGFKDYYDKVHSDDAGGAVFPTKAYFVMKVAGTVDISMMFDQVGTKAHSYRVYYINDRTNGKPELLECNISQEGDAKYVFEPSGATHRGEGGWDSGGNALTAKVRLQHMGNDGTCTLIFSYEGWLDNLHTLQTDATNEVYVKGFCVKRPDLGVTIGRTDTNGTNYPNEGNTKLTPYGLSNPYRWIFKGSGFDNLETQNVNDYRTYLCGYVDGDPNKELVWDHLLVYSENNTSYAHFVGTEGNEHLQFDSPTMFRYSHYDETGGTVTPGIQDINYDGDGSVFDPIVNDGLKVNVTGSGWFKVRARVPSDQNMVKMTIMTSVNGGNEHIKLLRYFKLPNDGRYHDYVAFLKASSPFDDDSVNPETTQQSLFVVFEDIGTDVYTTVPEALKVNDIEVTKLTDWQGDQNNFRVDLQYMEWLNDDVPDYVYQRGQYLFHSQTANDNVEGHDNNSLGRCRQTVYGKGGSGSSTTTPILYWQAGGAHKNAMVMLDKKYASQVDANGYITNPDGTDDAVYSYGDMYEITNHEKDASGTWYTTYKLIKNDDSALEDGRWAYDTNWMMVSGGTNPKYDEDGNYSTFGLAPDRGHSEAFTFGGQWDMAPMPTLGLSHFVESNYGENEDEIDNPNVDGVYTGATCQIESHNHNASNPAAASPLWQGAHTEMQSPRIFNQSYNESKRPGGTSSIDKFTWIGGTEWVARNKETNTEYDLPVSGPFYRFMPMKNVKITAYVVSGNAEGKIYVLDETGKIVKTNASGKDWYRLGSVTVENGTIDSDGIITPYSGDNSPLTSDNKRAKTVKITISARAGKEYFLTSTGMAIGVATMYFDEIPTSEIAKRSISSSAKAMHAPAGDGSNFLLYGEAKNTANIGSIIDDSGSKTVDVKIDRAFTAGTWQSIVLPFTMNEELFEKVFGKGAMALSFEKIEKNIVYLLHHQYNMITAGRPVFIRPTQNVEANYLIEDVTLSTKEVTSDDFIGVDDETYKNRYRFTGTLDPKTADGDCMIRGSLVMAPSDAGMSGKLMYMTKRTPSRALRSWIEPATEAPEAAAAKLMYAAFDYTGNLIESEELTGIESILNDYFDNENAFVIHEYDKVYDLNGRAVATGEGMDALPSGVYIVNGKKFVK